jgi:uncharacterized GH25 family protein
MLKKSLLAVLTLVMIWTSATSVFAHDGWTQTSAPIVETGEVAFVDILMGNHSNEHRSYRIDGQFSTNSNVFVTTPAGQKVDITSTRFYTGEPDSTNKVNNGFIASFVAQSPGTYIVTAESDGTRTSSGVTTRTLRNAKSFVAAADLPVVARVKPLTGFSRVINSDRAELIPLFNPASLTAGQNVSVKLLLKGSPLADTEVSIVRRSINTEVQTVKTNADGIASFSIGAADYYLFRSKPVTTEAEEGKYTGINYETTMSVRAQNAKTSFVSSANLAPQMIVNGKIVSPKKITIAKGVTMVDSGFFKQHISRNHKNNGVTSLALRQTLESLNASVEFLAGINGYPPTIVIHTQK